MTTRPAIAPSSSNAEAARERLSAPPPARARFHFIDDVDVENLPPLEWAVEALVPANANVCTYGPPESGKSVFAQGMALCMGSGTPFFGYAVRRGPVIYVSAEGAAGLGQRVGAWKHAHEWYDRAGVYFLTEAVQLLEPASVATFLAAIDTLKVAPQLIVLDTLHRCMVGDEENSGKDMGLAIASMDEIRRRTGATVLALHHCRKGGDAERGHTSLRGAMDARLECKRENDRITVRCEKMKDAAHFQPLTLELARVQESVVLVTANEDVAGTHLLPGEPTHRALTSLHEAATEEGLPITQWLKVSEMKERSFFRARKTLIALGYVDAERKRGGRNRLTAAGVAIVTANCHVTAN